MRSLNNNELSMVSGGEDGDATIFWIVDAPMAVNDIPQDIRPIDYVSTDNQASSYDSQACAQNILAGGGAGAGAGLSLGANIGQKIVFAEVGALVGGSVSGRVSKACRK